MQSIRIEPSSCSEGRKLRTTGPVSSLSRTDSLVSPGVPRSNHSSKSSTNGSSIEADICEAGAGEQVDELTTGEVARVRAVPRDFEHAVMGGDRGVRIGDVVAHHDHAAMPNQRDLPRQKGVRVDNMMNDKTRQGPVEGAN